jgi:hypothetical protein
MRVTYIVTSNGLAPLHDNDRDNHARLTVGNLYQKNFKKVRNPQFHRLVFDYLNAVYSFQDQFTDFEKFRKRIKLLIGDVEEDILEEKDGVVKIGLTYLSWDFGNMDEHDFQERFKRIKRVCSEHFCFTQEHFNILNSYD